ncbi:hypothetical protein J2T09_004726 [Neorhizobium huautlense]|uniref:PAS fold-3 domain-containing protein n=1 Tax=Neorhizobium huautlense TaxID=67774 RepID=A0ABT9Q0Q4_9HYPH|nr:PAS domain-containing protein [Neorhizobium huautlense]MDP9839946.1 hypothetical protein [Neorhizobium huautlense]
MPFWVEQEHRDNDQHRIIGISDAEAIELITAFRLFGSWRLDLDSGHMFASSDFSDLFGLEHSDGPMDMTRVSAQIHPDDLGFIMSTFERASVEKRPYHSIFRVGAEGETYRFLRSVGMFRSRPGSSGEVVGITYEFFPRRSGTAFVSDGERWPLGSPGPDDPEGRQ